MTSTPAVATDIRFSVNRKIATSSLPRQTMATTTNETPWQAQQHHHKPNNTQQPTTRTDNGRQMDDTNRPMDNN
jgi:hypothetical protein